MRARQNPWLAVLTLAAGGVLAASASTVGCGGKTDEAPAAPADTGTISIVDSSSDTGAVDTGTVVVDSGKGYDVPGSLFDADIPDIAFEGGTTAAGCYDCTLDKCEAEVKECDKDPRCRGLLLCVLTECAGSFTDVGCAFGCATKFDVSGLGDPVISKASSVGTCVQGKCAGACPSAPTPDGGVADAKTDSASETGAAETGGSGSGFKFSSPSTPGAGEQSIDPRVLDVLQQVVAPYQGSPDSRDRMMKHLAH